MMRNFQQSYHPLAPAYPRWVSWKMVVMSAKKSRKNGKTAPATIEARVPMASISLSDGDVYLNKEKKGAGGNLGSSGFSAPESLTSVRRGL
jgi:hypothetical protein